jgi:acyl carrier protein
MPESASRTTPPRLGSPAQFQEALVHFINQILPELHVRQKQWRAVDSTTPLFESGLIDSLAILHLVGFVERITGRPIPARLVSMEHFRDVEAICRAFGPDDGESDT